MSTNKDYSREQMNIVIVGHVDHGKSTVIGRLLADTGSLPDGKLEQVRATCERNSKPFEYAFLLDALKDEQAQGITIDTARVFFKTEKRNYIILDAPGHIEFLKNMITGAAHAEAALLVIDAKEGIQENTKRHGHMVSMLGIKQIVVLVNKMDLIDYDQEVFESMKIEYTKFLNQLNVEPITFIPISAMDGVNIASKSKDVPWYDGEPVVRQLDLLVKKEETTEAPFRMPVQDIYKFTAEGDDRRLVVGTVETGSVKVGDEVVFQPSGKSSTIKTVERFNAPEKNTAEAGEAVAFTLSTQIYIRPGELMVNVKEKQPEVSSRFKANIFWVGKAPMIKNKIYKLKVAATRETVKLVAINNILDASELTSSQSKQQIDRHDVAECIFETTKPVSYDLGNELETTGRFVIVDNYEIAGGGIILESHTNEETTLQDHTKTRENIWETGIITPGERVARFQHNAKFLLISGSVDVGKRVIAKELERQLFDRSYNTYYLGMANIKSGLDSDIMGDQTFAATESIRRLGEIARIMTDAGMIFITTVDDIDDYDLETLKVLNEPNEVLVVNIGDNYFSKTVVDLNIDANTTPSDGAKQIVDLLHEKNVLMEYYL